MLLQLYFYLLIIQDILTNNTPKAVTDHNFFDNFSTHLQSTLGQQAQGLSQLKIENDKMNSNKNLSGETKAVANVLDAVDAGVQAFGLVTGAVDGEEE